MGIEEFRAIRAREHAARLFQAINVPAEGRLIPDPLLPLPEKIPLIRDADQAVFADLYVPFDAAAGDWSSDGFSRRARYGPPAPRSVRVTVTPSPGLSGGTLPVAARRIGES